ncbi:bifunctional methionine sulfoxide reductase B/A protein [Candidatus Fermentibacteria bacterium]|nr:bifunctional methionine sulfoxide reductase B/A protein [Candidatus Fermentibacteria bacterium]
MDQRSLTPEEERVILHRGTEPPFSGKYWNHNEHGTYVCRRCGAPLYRSGDKFDAHCGWPSFDDSIAGAVSRKPDPDGVRTEITCSKCGAHLGHVFEGERFTGKNTRHCVNSISLDFEPEGRSVERAILAGGCFWGVEFLLRQLPGVLDTKVGYIGGVEENPTYEMVCSKTTDYAEAVEIAFDPARLSYEDLLKRFFEIHDPTQRDRQGPDTGRQYRSAVFYLTGDQKRSAGEIIGILAGKGLEVATEVVPATKFWPAEDYHQRYYERTGRMPYCHTRVKRF